MANARLTQQEYYCFLRLTDYVLNIKYYPSIITRVPTKKYATKIAKDLFGEAMTPGAIQNSLFNKDVEPNMGQKTFSSFCYQASLLLKQRDEKIFLDFKDLSNELDNSEIKTANLRIVYRHKLYKELFLNFREIISEKLNTINNKELDKNNTHNKVLNIGDRKRVEKKIIEKKNRQDFNYENEILLKSFEDTVWYCWERHEKFIGRKVITFSKGDDALNLSVRLQSAQATKENLYSWKGTARCNATKNFLIVNLVNIIGEAFYTHFLIRINPAYKDIMDACIAHMTYEHPTTHNCVTKTVILEKVVKEKWALAEPFEFKNERDGVPVEIQKFLNDRNKNRMSSPHKIIVTSLQSLASWMTMNEEEALVNNNLPETFVGKYHLYYKIHPYDENELQRDTLDITRHQSSNSYKIQYFHGTSEKRQYRWEGYGYLNFTTKLLSIFLEGPIRNAIPLQKKNFVDNEKNKPIFIMLNVPPEEDLEFIEDINALSGIASGVRDKDSGAVSRLIIAVKLDGNQMQPKNFNLSDLDKFFEVYAVRSWVRPPVHNSIFELDELNRTIDEGIAHLNAIKKILCDDQKKE